MSGYKDKVTPGPWISGWGDGLTGPTTASVSGPSCGGKDWSFHPVSVGMETVAICPNQRLDGAGRDQVAGSGEANAQLIAEAGTVLHETGYTPRELADQRAELLAALDKCATRAMPHADDTDADRVRDLYHIRAIADAAIAHCEAAQ